MREFFKVVSLEQARAHALGLPLVGTETVPLARAAGRGPARDLVCEQDLPGFRRSTVDGFAVQAASTFGASEGAPALLDVVGEVVMGRAATTPAGPGRAVRIPTGGMVPEGADAIVMIEHTEALDDLTIEVGRAMAPGDNLIAADEDAAAGQVVLTTGQRVRPQEAGLLAAIGQVEVEVFRRPVVAILSTGDEVVPPESPPGPGQVRDVNATTLSALVEQAGCVALPLGIVADDFDALLSACRQGFEQADTLLISGGSSVGTRDHTLDVLRALPDAELLVHGVAIKPGKPVAFGRIGDCLVLGLPGNPVSVMVTWLMFARPLLLARMGAVPVEPLRLRVVAEFSLRRQPGRREWLRARLQPDSDGGWRALTYPNQSSGALSSLVWAEGLVELPEDCVGVAPGDPVDYLPFNGLEIGY